MTTRPTTAARLHRVSVGVVALSVAEYEGAGPALVLIHGIGSRGVSWWPVVDELAQHFRLIVPDLRGHGDSDKPASGYLPTDYAADLAALVDSLGLAEFSIVGHSLGGIVALTWALSHPGRARRIVLEDVPLRGGSRADPRFDEWIALAGLTVVGATDYYRREYPGWTGEDCRRRAESITATSPAVFAELRDLSVGGDDADRIALLAAIRSPVLLVRGDPETGSMIAPVDAQRLVAIVPGARVAHIPGGTHFLHRDQSEAFLAAVVPFLLGEPASALG
ncbi:MAG TPA: alpha/beta hydrolase [Thermomicrobiales bacterium]|jgi:pimeloyl-ACP methyl ester carboxylesterase